MFQSTVIMSSFVSDMNTTTVNELFVNHRHLTY